MKLLVVFVAIAIASAYGLSKEDYQAFMAEAAEVVDKCSSEIHPSADDLTMLLAHKPPATHEGKCMIFCFYKHFKGMSDDGTPDKAAVIAFFDRLKPLDAELYDKVITIVNTCADKVQVQSDPCETAAGYFQCGKTESDAMGLEKYIV